MALQITCTARGKRSGVPFARMAGEILGSRYALSLVLSGDKLARRISRAYGKKDCAPNVLSFPLLKNEGEIFLNVRKAEREAKRLGVRASARVAHLFAHGCLHLKGVPHGEKMDSEEQRILERFGFGM